VTSEGKLCILDYGLMTTVDEDKRFALLEFVSNLLAKDYDATLDGLVILGIYMYVSVCLYIYVYVYIRINMYIHIYIYIRIRSG
jgi:predicted unusual protein kinase regulating ubiquinone biosynthesis (AarF/ABC1/UbiB family)